MPTGFTQEMNTLPALNVNFTYYISSIPDFQPYTIDATLVEAEAAGLLNYDSGYGNYTGTFEEQLLGLDAGENPLPAILNRNGSPVYTPPGEYGEIPEISGG